MSKHLDQELLKELEMLMEDEFPALLETFLADAQAQYLQISTTLNIADFDGLRRSAHSLKGSSANLGARALADLCSTLESQARRQQVSPADECIRLLADELESVCAEIRTHLPVA